MKIIFVVTVLCLAISAIYADDTLECYQCNPVTSECTVDKADQVKCGTMASSKCSKQVRKGSTDESKAIRKCVVPGANGQVACPSDHDCFNCNTDMCNAGSAAKVMWVSLIGVFFAVLYNY